MRGLMVFFVAANGFILGINVANDRPVASWVLSAVAMLCCGIAAVIGK